MLQARKIGWVFTSPMVVVNGQKNKKIGDFAPGQVGHFLWPMTLKNVHTYVFEGNRFTSIRVKVIFVCINVDISQVFPKIGRITNYPI